MNAKNLIVAAAIFAAAGSSFADTTGNFTDFTRVQSSKTRAEVVAELKQAKEQGYVASRDGADVVYATAATPRTRADVRAEAVAEAKTQKRGTSSIYFGG